MTSPYRTAGDAHAPICLTNSGGPCDCSWMERQFIKPRRPPWYWRWFLIPMREWWINFKRGGPMPPEF